MRWVEPTEGQAQCALHLAAEPEMAGPDNPLVRDRGQLTLEESCSHDFFQPRALKQSETVREGEPGIWIKQVWRRPLRIFKPVTAEEETGIHGIKKYKGLKHCLGHYPVNLCLYQLQAEFHFCDVR